MRSRKRTPTCSTSLLQILDDGRLTDGQGRMVDFKNTVVIMTSNLGSQALLGDHDAEAAAEIVMDAVREHFRPEFLNRIDELIVFEALTPAQLSGIVEIQSRELLRRLEERKISLSLSDAAKLHLAEVGYDPQYGARPLRRAIQRELLDPLALALLAGRFKAGDAVQVDVESGKLSFATAVAA